MVPQLRMGSTSQEVAFPNAFPKETMKQFGSVLPLAAVVWLKRTNEDPQTRNFKSQESTLEPLNSHDFPNLSNISFLLSLFPHSGFPGGFPLELPSTSAELAELRLRGEVTATAAALLRKEETLGIAESLLLYLIKYFWSGSCNGFPVLHGSCAEHFLI